MGRRSYWRGINRFGRVIVGLSIGFCVRARASCGLNGELIFRVLTQQSNRDIVHAHGAKFPRIEATNAVFIRPSTAAVESEP